MNINCIICSDLFIPSSAIYVTRCGHIFHYTCLIQWIERSKTCPQCRNKTNEKTIFRVFFNIVTQEGIEDDAVTLQSKLDAANLQLRLKESHVKSTEEKMKTITLENASLELKCKELKADLSKTKSGFANIKEQLSFYKDKAKCVEKFEKEIEELKTNLIRKENELKGITGDFDDLRDVISSDNCPKTLASIATALKKELQITEKKKNNLFLKMKRLENELHTAKTELEDANLQLKIEQHNLAVHKNCEIELQNLREKIKEMMNSSTAIDPALVRVATESPAPAKVVSRFNISPTLADRVKRIKESKSPYLKVRSSQLGIMQADPETTIKFGTDNISIFKNVGTKIMELRRPLPEYNYDGFGGHSKEDKFPVPIKKTGFKRSKTMSSSKFKKLAKPNKKLDEFLSMSQL